MRVFSMTTRRQTFSPAEHIRRRRDFQAAYATGWRIGGRYMTVFFRPNAMAQARLGITATRKLGGAVPRNRSKRLIREVFRMNKPGCAVDVVVLPRRQAITAPLSNLEADFRTMLGRYERQCSHG